MKFIKFLDFRLILGIILHVVTQSIYSQDNNKIIELQEVVEKTLQNNIDIKISYQYLKKSEGQLQLAKSDFNTKFSFNANNSTIKMPATLPYREGWSDFGKTNSFTNSYTSYSFSIAQKLAIGTIIQPEISYYNRGKDSLFNYIQNRNQNGLITNYSNISLNIIQPLLSGFGINSNKSKTIIAKLSKTAEDNNYIHSMAFQILQSSLFYIDYIYAYKNLLIQQEFTSDYKALTTQIDRLISLDAIPASDSLLMKAQLAFQFSNELYSRNNLIISKNTLGKNMGISRGEIDKLALPQNSYSIDNININDSSNYLNLSISESLNRRHDYIAYDFIIQSSDQSSKYYKSKIKPNLDLNLKLGYNGIYESNNIEMFYKPAISNIPGLNFAVGLKLDISPKQDKEKGEFIQAKAELDENQLKKELLAQEISADVKNYYNALFNLNEIIKQLKLASLLYKKTIDNEYTKLQLGTSTVLNVIQEKNNYIYTLNRLNEMQRDLNKTILLLKFTTGTLIKVNADNTLNIDCMSFFNMPDFSD